MSYYLKFHGILYAVSAPVPCLPKDRGEHTGLGVCIWTAHFSATYFFRNGIFRIIVQRILHSNTVDYWFNWIAQDWNSKPCFLHWSLNRIIKIKFNDVLNTLILVISALAPLQHRWLTAPAAINTNTPEAQLCPRHLKAADNNYSKIGRFQSGSITNTAARGDAWLFIGGSYRMLNYADEILLILLYMAAK